MKRVVPIFLAIFATSATTSIYAKPLHVHGNGVPMSEAHDLQKMPFISGRLATKADFETGTAIFYQEPAGSVYQELTLPMLADIKHEDGTIERVAIVQTEVAPTKEEATPTKNDVIVGYRTFAGGTGVGLLSEFKALPR